MAPTACPICSRHFRPENLALHVESCLQKSSADERRRQRAQELATPLFPLAAPKGVSGGDGSGRSHQQQQARRHSFPAGVPAGADDSSKRIPEASLGEAQSTKKRKREQSAKTSSAPLAERMRPTSLDDLVGQEELLGPGKLLSSLIQADRVPNMILWGYVRASGVNALGVCVLTSSVIVCVQSSWMWENHTRARDLQTHGQQVPGPLWRELQHGGHQGRNRESQEREADVPAQHDCVRRRGPSFQEEHTGKASRREIAARAACHGELFALTRCLSSRALPQDIFLPAVEDGTITLIGATTENPSFEINNALLSRCRVYVLKKHTTESIQQILKRAVRDPVASGLHSFVASTVTCADEDEETDSPVTIHADDDALDYLAKQCGGDARVALNCLEMAIQTAPSDTDISEGGVRITEAHVRHCFAHRQTLFYDRNADFHYDLISAFHKSIRGSDDNAALYWLARMLEGGENPLFIARRMIRIASEDIGLAAPELLPQAVAAYHAAHYVGMPECDLALAQCATMLARAPKSVDVYRAYKRVKQSIREWSGSAHPDVPMHLRNAPTKLMKNLGYNKGYLYNPDYTAEELKDQTYMPEELLGTSFFDAGHQSREKGEEEKEQEQRGVCDQGARAQQHERGTISNE